MHDVVFRSTHNGVGPTGHPSPASFPGSTNVRSNSRGATVRSRPDLSGLGLGGSTVLSVNGRTGSGSTVPQPPCITTNEPAERQGRRYSATLDAAVAHRSSAVTGMAAAWTDTRPMGPSRVTRRPRNFTYGQAPAGTATLTSQSSSDRRCPRSWVELTPLSPSIVDTCTDSWCHRSAVGSVHHYVHQLESEESPPPGSLRCPQRHRRPTGGARVHPAVPDRNGTRGVVEPQRRSRRSDHLQPRDRRCEPGGSRCSRSRRPTSWSTCSGTHRGAGGLLGGW
jgi:hypothetical protein